MIRALGAFHLSKSTHTLLGPQNIFQNHFRSWPEVRRGSKAADDGRAE
jgi:hypothetical protein